MEGGEEVKMSLERMLVVESVAYRLLYMICTTVIFIFSVYKF